MYFSPCTLSCKDIRHQFVTHKKQKYHHHHRSIEEQPTEIRLQLAQSWPVHTMSSSEKSLLGSILACSRRSDSGPPLYFSSLSLLRTALHYLNAWNRLGRSIPGLGWERTYGVFPGVFSHSLKEKEKLTFIKKLG